MDRTPATVKGPSFPQFGTIQGGVLHGWSYAFVQAIYVNGVKFMDLRVTQPHWPFSKVVRFGSGSFRRLKGGLRAKRIEVRPLFKAARELANTRKNT
jgi:hypothetical protein